MSKIKIYNIKDFKNGWIVGKFKPSLFSANVEISYRKYDILEKNNDVHYHAKTDEYNLVLSGDVRFGIKKRKKNSHIKYFNVKPGEIIKIPKNHITYFYSYTKSEIICIKTPAYKKPDKIVI